MSNLFSELWFWIAIGSTVWIATALVFTHYAKTHPAVEERILAALHATVETSGKTNLAPKRAFRLGNLIGYVFPKAMFLLSTTSDTRKFGDSEGL